MKKINIFSLHLFVRFSKKYFLFSFVTVIFIANGFFISIAHADATIVLESILEEDTHWTIEESPYLIYESLSINEGITLTIDSGVVVKFEEKVRLIVNGSLRANGTEDNPIYFTSSKDDSLGGDTNFDGDDTVSNKGDWYEVVIIPEIEDPLIDSSTTESSTLDNVISRYSSDGLLIFDKNVSSEGLDIDNQILFFNSNSIFSRLSTLEFTLFEGSIVSVNDSTLNSMDSFATALFDASKLDITNSSIHGCQDCRNIVLIFDGSALSLDDVNIDTENKEEYTYGMMIFDEESILTMKGSSMIGAYSGIFIDTDTKVVVEDSIFECIYSCIEGYSGSLLMTNSKISGASGFGIVSYGSSKTIQECSESYSEEGEFEETCEDIIINFSFEINNNEIFGNGIGIASYGGKIVGKNNSIHDNTINLSIPPVGAFNISEEEGGNIVDLRNNFWGDKTGPYNLLTNSVGLGNEVSDNILFKPFLKFDPLKRLQNPVILIPGITGTYLIKDYGDKTEIWPDINRTVLPGKDINLNPLYLEIDGKENIEMPIVVGDIVRGITLPVISDIHVFDRLISELIDNGGYIEGEDLFVFPYDWRISTSENALLLKEKIEEILLETGYENVDIVAHSMGGLIAKKYIADNGKDKIDQLIFVGTPQLGAPKAFKALMYGDNMGYGISISDTKKVSVLNASRVKYISQNMPSVYELLPSAKYIESNGSYVTDALNEIIDLSSFDLNYLETQNFMIEKGRNPLMFPFAENLHDNIDNLDLSDIETHNFIGCGTKTIGGIIAKQKRSWKNLFLGFVDDIHLKYVNGDETVPLESANKAIGAKMYFAKGNTHGSLPSAEGVRQNILSILKGEDLESYANILDDASTCNVSGEVVSTHSPVELHIYDEEGNHTGPNADGDIEYGIDGVQYDIVEGENYVFLPSGVNYRIVTNATDIGGYNFDIESLDEEDNITDTHEWILIPLETINSSGEIWIGPDYPESDYSVKMDENGDGIIDENYKFSYNGTTEAEIATAPSRKFSSGSVPQISLIPVTAIQNLEIKTPVLEPVQEKKELAVNIVTITDIDKGKNINKEKEKDFQIKQDIIKDDNIKQNNLFASVGDSGIEIGLLWPAIILFGFIGISLAKMFIKL